MVACLLTEGAKRHRVFKKIKRKQRVEVIERTEGKKQGPKYSTEKLKKLVIRADLTLLIQLQLLPRFKLLLRKIIKQLANSQVKEP